jgi:hypothetical protein
LVDPQHAWRLEELAKAADVSLGHAHNVVKRLEELSWVERNSQQRIQVTRPGELLDAWVEAYSYRQNDVQAYFSPERITRGLVAELGRALTKRTAGTRSHSIRGRAGGPERSLPGHPLLSRWRSEPVARALGLRPGEGEEHLPATWYDQGVFYAPLAKGGLPVVCLPQLFADLYHYERRGREQAAHLRREAMGY